MSTIDLCLSQYSILKEIYLRHNTALPASAVVERLFSKGDRICTPTRSRHSDFNFEKLKFCQSDD